MPGRGWVIALLLAAALAGCGSSGDKAGLTSGQAAGLVAQLEAARATAAAHDVAGTESAIAKFRSSVASLRRAGALTDEAARLLRVGAARVLQRVKSDNATPAQAPPVTQTTPAPTPAPAPPGKKKHEDRKPPKPGKGHDKKHGGEGDD